MVVIPGWDEDDVSSGRYLDTAPEIRRSALEALRRNENPRLYHVKSQDGLLVGDVVFDMNLFSTVPPAFAEAHWTGNRVAALQSPWREHMSRHFTNYLSRIALEGE